MSCFVAELQGYFYGGWAGENNKEGQRKHNNLSQGPLYRLVLALERDDFSNVLSLLQEEMCFTCSWQQFHKILFILSKVTLKSDTRIFSALIPFHVL